MKKRGQVTIFVIIALAILFVIGVTYFVKEIVIEQRIFSEIKEPESIPSQIQAVNFYVDGCIDDVALEAIALTGLQGGYIEIPEDNVPQSSVNKFSNGVSLPGLKVPYWYYEDFNGEINGDFPSLDDVEEGVAGYVRGNLEDCIDDFSGLEGFEIDAGNVVSEVSVESDEVYVMVRYPLDIDKDGDTYNLNDHVQVYENRLGDMYEQAKNIIEKENVDLWLENRTVEIISLYDEEIPSVVLDFGCGPLIYSEREIAENFKEALAVNVPLYYVEGSKTEVSGEFPELGWDLESNNELYVDFLYDMNWPISLDVHPSEGDVILLEPFEGSIVFGKLCANYEQLFYDVKYPVVVAVRDDSGLVFQFAVQVILNANEPRGQIGIVEDDSVRYCDVRTKEVDVYVDGVDEEGFVGPLEGADVFYRCVNNNCYIGETDESGYLRGSFPTCGNGEVNAKKEDYVEDAVSLTTFDEGENEVSLSLDSFVEKEFRVMVYDLVNGVLVGPRELNDDEQVIFQISLEDEGRTVFGDVGIVPGEENTISLTPDVFYLKANLVKTTPTLIEGKTIERCKGLEVLGVCAGGTEKVEIPSEEVESVILGGAEMDWVVKVGEVYSDNVGEIYVINNGVPKEMEDLNLNFDLVSLTEGHEVEVRPKFI
tara:strand:- start:2939 stop:4891 length:1953 start_codon:yes stop_codon:yes gene_type:complete